MIEKISDILIVSDIDGTLLREANGLSEENRAAIKRFTDKGGRFTVSTGRAIEAAKLFLRLAAGRGYRAELYKPLCEVFRKEAY